MSWLCNAVPIEKVNVLEANERWDGGRQSDNLNSTAMYESYLSNPNVRAFLDVLAYCEGADYNTVFGGGSFVGWQHPCRKVQAGGYNSDAAGRYQFLCSTWRGLGLQDFSPANQDLGAIILIAQKGALQDIANGDLQTAVSKCRGTWPSLPGGSQQTRNWSQVTSYFQNDLAAQGVAPVIIAQQPPPVYDFPAGIDIYDDGSLFADYGESTSGLGIGVVAAVGVALLALVWWTSD
jgi:muramidase (phage lysozyme)